MQRMEETYGKRPGVGQCAKGGPHEANYLKLDCSKLKHTFGWKSCWDVEMAVDKTVEWYACYHQKENLVECTRKQIEDFLKVFEQNGK